MRPHFIKQGLETEDLIRQWLTTQMGRTVAPSSTDDNVKKDIDFWLTDGIEPQSVSVKCQTAGIKYGEIYFELWSDRSYDDGKGWYYTGSADVYLIVRDPLASPSWVDISQYGNYQPRFCWLPKVRVQEYERYHGFRKTRSLSGSTLSQQNGYNTTCAYVKVGHLLTQRDIVMLPYNWREVLSSGATPCYDRVEE